MLSRLVITFLSKSKCLLISWLQSPSAVIFGAPKNTSSHCFHCFPSICHKVMGPDAMVLVFWVLSFRQASSLTLLFHFHQEALQLLFTLCGYPDPCGMPWRGSTIIPRTALTSSRCFTNLLLPCQRSPFMILVFWNTYSVPPESGRCPTPGPFYRWRNWGTAVRWLAGGENQQPESRAADPSTLGSSLTSVCPQVYATSPQPLPRPSLCRHLHLPVCIHTIHPSAPSKGVQSLLSLAPMTTKPASSAASWCLINAFMVGRKEGGFQVRLLLACHNS